MLSAMRAMRVGSGARAKDVRCAACFVEWRVRRRADHDFFASPHGEPVWKFLFSKQEFARCPIFPNCSSSARRGREICCVGGRRAPRRVLIIADERLARGDATSSLARALTRLFARGTRRKT